MAPLDVVQADAEAATRRGAVTTAEANLRTAELTLKRLIVNGTDAFILGLGVRANPRALALAPGVPAA